MARRRDRSFAGRRLAGRFGDLFVHCDGVTPLLDGDEVYPDKLTAAAAWERARAATWRHECRDTMWPAAGACAHDGITVRTRWWHPAQNHKNPRWSPSRVAAAVAEDVASVQRFRTDRPDAAASIAGDLDGYTADLEILAGLAAMHGTVAATLEPWCRWEVYELRSRAPELDVEDEDEDEEAGDGEA